MPTFLEDLFEEITHELGNLKTDKVKDRVKINNFLKNVRCLSYDVF